MIKEAYCSFDVSKLLKEKGFEQLHCLKQYNLQGDLCEGFAYGPVAPTHQLAMAWMREKKNLIITIDYDRYPVTSDEDKTIIGYGYNIQTKGNPEDYYSMSESVYNSYEEAVEAALKYCLIKLI